MKIRKRTIISLITSLIIHAIIWASVTGIMPKLYIPEEPKTEPLPYEKTEVEFIHSQALSRPALKRNNLSKQISSFSKNRTSALNQDSSAHSVNRLYSVRQNLANNIKFHKDEKGMLNTSNKEQFESMNEPNTRIKTNVGSLKINRGYANSKSNNGNEGRDEQIGSALKGIAGQIVNSASNQKIDVIFLIDTSGSMLDNIHSVARNLKEMIAIFREGGLDYAVGVVKFKYTKLLSFPLTEDYTKYERLLMNVKCGGDERAYNALVKSLKIVKFRQDATKRFILITDEELKGSYNIIDIIEELRKQKIVLDIIGLNTPLQRNLPKQTGGIWFQIPQ